MSRLCIVPRFVFVLPLFGCFLSAQTVPPLAVDVSANRHAISPDIYGINDYADTGLADAARVSVRRWGGDATTDYNWQNDTYNSAGDYYFENYAYPEPNLATLPSGSQFDRFIETGLKTGTKRIGSIPMLGWLPKTRDNLCGFSVAKYGPQAQVDPYHTDCGNGYMPDGQTQIFGNDPTDTSMTVDQTFSQQWIEHVIAEYGTSGRGGVQIWSLDNEPDWWYAVHRDIHPNPGTYDEIFSRGMTYAAAIKATDPGALVTGPVAAGWMGFFFSSLDFTSGWHTAPYQFYDNPVDQEAHGNVPLVEWYMQQMRNYEQQHGTRLLDYVDVHAYISPNNIDFATSTTPAETQLRLTSTRVFWDPNYASPDGSTPSAAMPYGEPPYLIPRMQQWVANDYPGTKTAITEYNWGMLNDITGAVAQADILGIFGREGLDLGCMWAPPDPTKPDPGVFAFYLYLNYDGNGSQFGETSVSATTGNPDVVSIFAAQRSDSALTIVVLNKTDGALTAPISIANFQSAGTAQVWQYNSGNLTAIERLADVPVSSGSVDVNLPAYSMTLLVIPASSDSLPVPQPVIQSVGSAASYSTASVAPGEIVVLFGTNLGPAALAPTAVTSNGYLTQSVGNVRVLFNGVPAPMVYASAGQVSAIVPYEAALFSSTSVQVEVQGVRSDPFPIPVAAAAPALFSLDSSGAGPGAILNQDLTVNSAANPAARGAVVVLFATGEGQTVPPGVDGRIALDIVPVPVGTCAVTIGGQPATVAYCGEAPDQTSGLLQINAQVPTSLSPGVAKVVISIGGVASNDAVTVALK